MSNHTIGILQRLCAVAVLCLAGGTTLAQGQTDTPARNQEAAPSSEEVARLHAAVEANPADMEAHKAYLKTFKTAEEARSQYEQWMKKYPREAAIPRALGDKYGHYSPEARQYWLKAAELQPKDPEIWKTLALDASIRGDRARQREFIGKALAADPDNLDLQYEYASRSREIDDEAGINTILELARKHPKAPETVRAYVGLTFAEPDIIKRIGYAEQLRNSVSGAELTNDENMALTVYHVAMMRLVDAYLQTGQYEKAVELSKAMIAEKAQARLNFDQRLKLSTMLADIDARVKQGRMDEARGMLEALDALPKSRIETASRVELLKASILDATGSTQEAYDMLLTFQARTPDLQAQAALEQYGRKLGKDSAQIRRELRSVIAENSKPAPSFALDTYDGRGQVRLEDLKGKVVLLSFWYPACGPCRGEMPHTEAGIKAIDRNKLVYLGVNGVRSQDEFVLPFMQSSGYSFTPLAGMEEMLKDYGVRAYPTNFIIDQEGRIAYSGFMVNVTNEVTLNLMIRALLDSSEGSAG